MKKILLLAIAMHICHILTAQTDMPQAMYTYYPAYNVVRCTTQNIFNLSYPVQKVSPKNATGTVLGYVTYKEENEPKEQQYALVLNSAKSDIIGIDIAHHASGLLHGPGIPMTKKLKKEVE